MENQDEKPNAKTVAAMEAVRRGKVYTSGSIEELIKDLNAEDLPDDP